MLPGVLPPLGHQVAPEPEVDVARLGRRRAGGHDPAAGLAPVCGGLPLWLPCPCEAALAPCI